MTRSFVDAAVPQELIEGIIADAARAPSAGKTQGWHVIELVGNETERFWNNTLPDHRREQFGWPRLLDAPVILVVLSDPPAYVRRYSEDDKARTGLGVGPEAWPVDYWTVDASMAAMMILLGAEAVGLGALFFGVFNGESELRDALRIPDELQIIGAIALGYPLDDRDAARPGRSASRPTREPDAIIHRGAW